MISETSHSSQTKLIGYDLHVSEQGIGYSNLTPDPRTEGQRMADSAMEQMEPELFRCF